MDVIEPPARAGYLTLLRGNRNFRSMWSGELVSYLGDWFNTIALFTAVQAISSSAQAISAVLIAKTLPVFLVSPIAGPLVERYDRRKLLIMSDLLRSLSVLGLIVSYHFDSLIGLFAFTTVMIAIAGIVLPSKSSSLPMIVPAEHLAIANALSGGTWSIMLALGSAIGGIATEYLGVTASFAIDGLTFLASASFFYRLPPLRPPGARASKAQTGFIEGLRHLLRTPYILALASVKSLLSLSTGAVTLIPLFGKQFGGRGALSIGVIYTCRGLGAFLGSILVRLIVGDGVRTLRRMILFGCAVAGLGLCSVSFSNTLLNVGLGFFLTSLGGGLVWVFVGTLLQSEADRAFHGRIFSTEFGVSTLLISLSSWGLGYCIDRGWSLNEAARLASASTLLPLAVWSFALFGRRRTADP